MFRKPLILDVCLKNSVCCQPLPPPGNPTGGYLPKNPRAAGPVWCFRPLERSLDLYCNETGGSEYSGQGYEKSPKAKKPAQGRKWALAWRAKLALEPESSKKPQTTCL